MLKKNNQKYLANKLVNRKLVDQLKVKRFLNKILINFNQ